ncbi:uncharacterized protein [Elaeis guineensis]|uniref:uncharacterized protein n=1 Tax=Elaeis guineensis var. tenera TaxID=51953 RepID=UPI003C6D5696
MHSSQREGHGYSDLQSDVRARRGVDQACRSMLFANEIDLETGWVLERACCLTTKYLRFDAVTGPLDTLDHWDSHAAPAAPQWTLFISQEPPPSRCVKVNFDDSVRGSRSGADFVIRCPDAQLLAAGGFHLYESSVSRTELHAAWFGITFVVWELCAERIFIKGDSATIIVWIQDGLEQQETHPLICDIWTFFRQFAASSIRHIYRKMNSTADWIAAFVAEHSKN